MGLLHPLILATIFFILCTLLVFLLCHFLYKLPNLKKDELLLTYVLVAIWLLHFLQVVVPETGFDAVWYHLPVISKVYEAQSLVFLPELYQSVNPLFSDLYFLTGYSVLGDTGTKLIAYIFGVLLICVTYCLSRLFLSRKFSILIALVVSTFQVIAWQSASFYIDVAKAFFELSGLFFIFYSVTQKNKKKFWGLAFFSASLASKVFSLLLVPFFIFSFGLKEFFSMRVVLYLVILFGIPLFYFYFAYIHTGNPLYSVFIHVDKLQEISGEGSVLQLILYKVISLPKSILIFTTARDYVNPMLLLFFIPILLKMKSIMQEKKLQVLLLFSVAQWLLWWFVPPVSTRYALSGFITLLLLGVIVVKKQYVKTKQQEKYFFLVLLFFALLAVVPRVIVAHRSLQYILGFQNQKEYLNQFYDGSIDEKIKTWYKL